MASFVGIDLGTTFSAVAHIDDTGRPAIVHNDIGANITPSVVWRSGPDAIVVGEEARKQWSVDSTDVAARFKRDMGTSRTWVLGDQSFSPTDLSTFVLRKLRADTIAATGDIVEAVVTTPANFSHEAREATMAAATAAGLPVKFIINEPTAAALYYAFKSGTELGGVYAVYDLGGGTFDVSVIRVDGQDIDVLASNGVSRLGGDDFDEIIQKIVAAKYKSITGMTLDLNDYTKNQAEEDKKSLSRRETVKVRVGQHNIEISREDFTAAISSLIAQTEMLCEATVEEAGVALSDIRSVFLVGGSTRIPSVQRSVERVFKMKPESTANVDEVVALGAALYAAYKGDRSHLSPVQQSAIGRIAVTESTSKCFGTLSLTHDAARGAVMENAVLIRKGAKIPCSVTKSFYTIREGQEVVTCDVTESTSPEKDPRFVKVIWRGDLALPAGRPTNQEVVVTFAYDVNQMMRCSFIDKASGRETAIDLSMGNSGRLDTSAVDRFLVE